MTNTPTIQADGHEDDVVIISDDGSGEPLSADVSERQETTIANTWIE